MKHAPFLLIVALLLQACDESPKATAGQTTESAEKSHAELAQELTRSSIIVDGHIDIPYRLYSRPDDVSIATDGGDFDYPRAVAGGLNAPFMSIYTPANYMEEDGKAYRHANTLIDMMEQLESDFPDKFAVATSVADVRSHFDQGLISLLLGMENGSPLEGELANVDYFFERGIRYISLSHSLSNRLSDSSYDINRQWDGLSELGFDVIRRMNELGILIDVSHVSDAAFFDILDVTTTPVIASHSSVRHFTPGWERNMGDDMIRRLGENGGVIMINFGSSFVIEEALAYGTSRRLAYAAFRAENAELEEAEARQQFGAAYTEKHGPYPYATLEQVLDHFDHVVELAGIDHVGIGSDYDGVGDSLPIGLKDVSAFPNLVEGLLGRGYSEGDIRKILGENLLRVWSEVESAAATSAAASGG